MSTTKKISSHNHRINKATFAEVMAFTTLMNEKTTTEMKYAASDTLERASRFLRTHKRKEAPGAFGSKGRKIRASRIEKPKFKNRKYETGESFKDANGTEYVANKHGALMKIIRVDGKRVPVRQLRRNKKQRRRMPVEDREFYEFAVA